MNMSMIAPVVAIIRIKNLCLALSLFMPWVDANHVDAALAANHFAVIANAFHARANFHDFSPVPEFGKAFEYIRLNRGFTRGKSRF